MNNRINILPQVNEIKLQNIKLTEIEFKLFVAPEQNLNYKRNLADKSVTTDLFEPRDVEIKVTKCRCAIM